MDSGAGWATVQGVTKELNMIKQQQNIIMVGWHHRLDRHEFEPASGVGVGQGSLACCGS